MYKGETIKTRQGKTFIEFTDDFGWVTRIDFKKNDLNLEIKQSKKSFNESRYISLDEYQVKRLLIKLGFRIVNQKGTRK